MTRIFVGVPTAGRIEAKTSFSITYLMVNALGRYQISMGHSFAEGSNLPNNREVLVEEAIEKDCSHVFFVDDDMVFPPEIIKIMLERDKPIVVTNYLRKQHRDFMAVGDREYEELENGQPVKRSVRCRVLTTEQSTGLQEIVYAGFGCSLIQTHVFKEIAPPWFLPVYLPDERRYSTEDLPFFATAAYNGFPCWLDHDASKLVGHVDGSRVLTYRDFIVGGNA